MARFYLLTAAIILTSAPSVFGQPAPERPVLGATFSADLLRELPASGNPMTVLDTVQMEAIADRFVASGLNSATPPRAGGLLNSWTQTQYRLGDIVITDPLTGGVPMMLPFLPFFSRVTVASGAMGVDDNAAALSMTLEPISPTRTWMRAFEASATGGALVHGPDDRVPAVDRIEHVGDGNIAVSGPITSRVAIAAAGAWRGLSHFEGTATTAAADNIATGFAHVAFAATSADEIRGLAWAQHITTPTYDDTALHAQGTWHRLVANGMRWRAFAAYTERKRTAAPVLQTITVDSLVTDPVSDLFANGGGTSRTWTAGARLVPAPSSWIPSAGVDLSNARVRVLPSGVGQIQELVDGVRARTWIASVPQSTDFRHLTNLSGFLNEHSTWKRLTIDAGLRVDHASGAADAATQGVSWTTVLPRGFVEWQVTQKMGIALTAAYRRSAYQMPLNVLAIGDPDAPTAEVARWTNTTIAPLARIGPGTGGDATFARIDPDLDRPVTDELTLAVRARPFHGFEVELARVVKRESSLLSLVDVGVPFSSYAAFAVPDPSYVAATAGPFDRPFTIAFDRPAGAYGKDRYLLTNAADDPAESWAMELNVRATTERVTLLAGIALTWAYGPAAAIGFLPTQNDQDLVGNLFVDANRETYARGQLFQDRSHVGKIAGVYRFGKGFSLGAIARYQDGQPFSRLVAVPGLNQGPTMVRAYRNGGAAFTYTGTFDVRLQRTMPVGRTTMTAGLDVYNLGNMEKEVSEYVVAGPRFRDPTALQPPRTALLSVRVAY